MSDLETKVRRSLGRHAGPACAMPRRTKRAMLRQSLVAGSAFVVILC
jgi:hypothetical protein